MKKIIIVSLSFVFLFGFSLSVLAVNTIPDSNITSMQSIIDLIDTLVNWFYLAVLAIAVFMLLVAAFTWLTSAGNEDKVTSARKMLIWALVGIAVALVAKGLITIVKVLVGVS